MFAWPWENGARILCLLANIIVLAAALDEFCFKYFLPEIRLLNGCCVQSLEDDAYCWGSPEDNSMLQACSMLAHKSLLLCVQECSAMPNLPEEIRPTFSTEDMMLAVNDSCAVGKLFSDDGAFCSGGFQLQNVTPSYQEQDSER